MYHSIQLQTYKSYILTHDKDINSDEKVALFGMNLIIIFMLPENIIVTLAELFHPCHSVMQANGFG